MIKGQWHRQRKIGDKEEKNENETWNIRSSREKEEELVEEILQENIEMLGIAETKQKGKCCKRIHKRYKLYWSKVDEGK